MRVLNYFTIRYGSRVTIFGQICLLSFVNEPMSTNDFPSMNQFFKYLNSFLDQSKICVTSPVRIPPKGEQTPLAALTADLPIEAVTGIEPTNDPAS